MNVFIIEGCEGVYGVFSTARKAIEAAIREYNAGDWQVFVDYDFEKQKQTEYPLSNVKRAISDVNKKKFITAYNTGQDKITISLLRVS